MDIAEGGCMYTTCHDYKKMVSGLYREWKERNRDRKDLLSLAEKIKEEAFKEAHRYDPQASGIFSEDTLIRHCDQLACYSTDYHGGFCIIAPRTDTHQLAWFSVHSTNCINCVLFSFFFHGFDCSLLIEPELINAYDWKTLQPLTGTADLKLIASDLTADLQKPKYTGYRGIVWDLVNDELLGIRQIQEEGYQNIERGYPVDINVFREKFEKIDGDTRFLRLRKLFLSQPQPDAQCAAAGFFAKKKLFAEFAERKNRDRKLKQC